jgi:hypothetical protein
MKGQIKYKNSIGDTLSNLVGTEGFRTDVSVSLTPMTTASLFLIIPLTVAAGIIIADLILKRIK